jgi:hypothetical protein
MNLTHGANHGTGETHQIFRVDVIIPEGTKAYSKSRTGRKFSIGPVKNIYRKV